MKKIHDKDAYGKGLLAYFEGDHHAKFTVYSDIAETEKWDIATFFRDFDEMPESEQIALNRCKGRILDVGAGAGNHLLWLQNKQFDVTGIDISEGAVQVMKKRGVKDARLQNFFDFKDEKYDTLLLLMNGVGITQTIDKLPLFFNQAKSLLNSGGKILLDSSNIIYLFLDDDGSALIDLNSKYYGEMEYRMDFKNLKGDPFDWLFIDFESLQDVAIQYGFTCEKIYEDEHYLFVAELTMK